MMRYTKQAIFGLNVAFALLGLGLLTLDVVGAEVVLTNGQMMQLEVIAADVDRGNADWCSRCTRVTAAALRKRYGPQADGAEIG
jgi:hypothetical protein